MRATIRRDNVKIEFSGRGQIWNELLRPYFGGPEAPTEQDRPAAAAPRPAPAVQLTPHRPETPGQPSSAAPPPRPAAPSQPRTWYPPRREAQPPQPQRFEPQRFEPQRIDVQRSPAPQHYSSGADDDESDTIQVEPSADPATLYARLAAIPGRRSERDAVLAAVWFLTNGERETTSDDIEAHFQLLRVFPDLKVTPHVLKHIHRTKMLEPGSNPKSVRFSRKGIASVRGRLVPV